MLTRATMAVALLLALTGAVSAASPAGRWIATEIGGQPVARGVETTLDLDVEGRVSGSGGCNRYGGTASVEEAAIRFGMMQSTRMACPAPEMNQESRFHQALFRAASWRLEADRLDLLDAAGTAVARFLRRR
ncbi:MAG: META domain-containing protein [Siculibacillus sp.]|nr:META domain-containing protein [Siculibacillus sp.]